MKFDAQRGATNTELLVIFLFIVLVALIALPKFMSWRKTSAVPAVVTELRRLAKAQATYRNNISVKQTFGSLGELKNAGLLEKDFTDFEIDRNYEETRFCVANGTYAVGTGGKVYEGQNIGCRMGEITGTDLKPVQ